MTTDSEALTEARVRLDPKALESAQTRFVVTLGNRGRSYTPSEAVAEAINAYLSALGTAPAVGWRETAEFLWGLLDHIDTLDDACREDDSAFRKAVYKWQRRRFEVGSTDGYTVTFKAVVSPAPATAAEIRALDALIEELKRHDTFVFGGNASQQGGVGIMKEQMIKRLSSIRALSEATANGK